MPEPTSGNDPTTGPRLVERPASEVVRTRGRNRGLVLVQAGPGWGKSALLTGWADDAGAARLAVQPSHRDPGALAADLCGVLGADPYADPDTDPDTDLEAAVTAVLAAWHARPVPLALDDVDRVADSPGGALLAELLRQRPEGTRVLLTSQPGTDLIGAAARAAGRVLDLDARQLALDPVAVAALVAAELGSDDVLAARLAERTGGWPAAVRLLLDALADVDASRRTTRLATLTGATGPVDAYLREVVVPALDDEQRRALVTVALLGALRPEQLAALSDVPVHRAQELLDRLVAFGAVRAADRPWSADAVAVLPVLRGPLTERHLAEAPGGARLVEEITACLVERAELAEAARVLRVAGRTAALAQLLEEHGRSVLHAGELEAVRDAVLAVPAATRGRELWLLLAHAAANLGAWDHSTAALAALGAEGDGPLDAEGALAAGLVAHLRGQVGEALEHYARADGAQGPVAAELLGWRSTGHWLRGEVEEARSLAGEVHTRATALRDDRLLALAHTARALVAASDGDRRANQQEYDLALAAARRAGDRLQEVRILTNRGSLHLEEGRFEVALRETEAAIDLAERQGSAHIGGIARCNRAEILLKLGALDEAIADAEIARDRFAAIGSRHEAYAHHILGDARRERGELVLARRAYERSLQLAGDRQGSVPALIGLARTLTGTHPEEAARTAERALADDDGMHRASALLATGWVALATGDREAAAGRVAEAEAEATRRGDRAGLAEAATLGALLEDDPRPGLREAASQWLELDSRISATRVELGLLRRSDRPGDRSRAAVLERQLRSWGCAVDHGAYAHVAVLGNTQHPRCTVRVLGEFSVEHEGRPVPAASWGSRKARDLLKVLASRSSRGATREELADLLWPDEPYDTVANRLSVALSVVRGVLAPAEGERDASAIVTDGSAVRLALDRLELDLERFERLAEAGLSAVRDPSDRERARDLLDAAEQAYGGDLLEHDHDVAWLEDRREQLRATYVSVARSLAELVLEDDPDRTVRLLLRVLDRDPFDEPAHLGVCVALRRAGRHGESHRRHRLYQRRMEELGLPARPWDEIDRALRPRSPRIVSA